MLASKNYFRVASFPGNVSYFSLQKVIYLFKADRFRGIGSNVSVEQASFEDALRVEAVIEAIRKSSSEKQWVKVHVQTQPDLLLLDKSKLFLAAS